MRLERHYRNGEMVLVLKRRERPVEQTIDQFEPVGTGGTLKFWQQRLRQVREERHLTQENVAYRSGMSVSGYRKLETGIRGNVRLATLERVCWVLGCDVKDLL
jgi:DNA-binding Xre family transcriptional regulator